MKPFEPKSEEEAARAITGLADGEVSEAERPAVEAWAAQRPDVELQVANDRRVARALRETGPDASPALIATIEARSERASAPRERSLRPRPALAALAVTIAALALVVGITLGGGSSPNSPAGVAAAAKLAFSPATEPAPVAKTATLLDVSYAGITYPNYGPAFGVTADGARLDRIGGRPALTVFYSLRDGGRLSYTVFSGSPVPRPTAAKAVVFEGVPLHSFSTPSGLQVVTLVRFGRTCVLAARTSRDTLLTLAAAPVRAQTA